MIYADNAATTALDIDAYEAMKPYLLSEYGNASQPYTFSRSVKKALRNAREAIAECINADPDEIFFTSGGTESDNWALKGTMLGSEKASSLITSEIEHHAVLNSAAAIRRFGYPVQYVPVNASGTVTPDSLLKALNNNDTRLVSIMFSNNEIGTIEPIQTLASIAHAHGALFHTDAVQAVGHIPIDVHSLNVDMLSASGHKFNGPKGVGFLYLKKGIELGSYINGGSQEFGKRAGTENIASIVGMAVALKNNVESIISTSEHLRSMEQEILRILKAADIDFLRNGADLHTPGNISLSFKDAEGEMLLHRMDLKGICISTGSACDSVNTQISHVIKALHLPGEYSRGTIRISLGKNNTLEEAELIGKSLISILKN